MLNYKIDVYKQNILKSFGDNQLKVILLYENKETEWLYQRRKFLNHAVINAGLTTR